MSDDWQIIRLHKPGTFVTVRRRPGCTDVLTGQIASVWIKQNSIEYEVVWWDGAVRKKEFMQEMEITTESPPCREFGFSNKEPQ